MLEMLREEIIIVIPNWDHIQKSWIIFYENRFVIHIVILKLLLIHPDILIVCGAMHKQ